jgi:cell division protein FtsB
MASKFVNSLLFSLAILILIYISSIGIKNIFRYNEFKQENESLKIAFENELIINKQLTSEVKLLKDESYLENLVRTTLFYIKPGEEVYKFVTENIKNNG